MGESDFDLLQGFQGMYDDGYGEVSCYSRKVVRTRAPHNCPGMFTEAVHEIPVGTRAVLESALVAGAAWSRVYTCEACIRAFVADTSGQGEGCDESA